MCHIVLGYTDFDHTTLFTITCIVGSSLEYSIAYHLRCRGRGVSSGCLEGDPVYLYLISLVEGFSFMKTIQEEGIEGSISVVSIRLVANFTPNESFYFPYVFVSTSVKSLHILSWIIWDLVEINPKSWSEVHF